MKIIMENKIKKLSNIEASYIAGLIDARGYFELSKMSNGYVYQRVTLYVTHDKLLEWLTKRIGFHSFKQTVKDKFIVRNKERNVNYERTCCKIAKKEDVLKLLEQLTPFLIVKKHQARILIDYLDGSLQKETALKKFKITLKKFK